MTDGPLSNEQVQAARKAEERKLRDFEAADLEAVLRTPEGRRLYYRIVFELCRLEAASWTPAVKDGMAASMHQSFLEGVRHVGQLLKLEAETTLPYLYMTMVQEAVAAGLAALEARKLAASAPTKEITE